MIAGEGLVGILLAIFAVIGIDQKLNLSKNIDLGTIGGIVLIILMTVCVAVYAMKKEKTDEKES